MIKSCYAWLAAAALLAGCHHDAEIAPDLTGTYTATTTVRAAHPIALYTQAGQVNDQGLISRFLARRAWLAGYFSATDQVVNSGVSTQLAFRGGDRVTLRTSGTGRQDSILTRLATRPASSLLLQSVDTLRYFTSASSACSSRLNDLADYVRNFSAPTSCSAVSPVTGYNQYCRTSPIWLVGVRNGQLFIPYLSWYAQVSTQTGRCDLVRGGEWNTFNSAAISHLSAGDTLVVQEREIDFQK